MSRLTFWASSISAVSSGERNPRHQSSVGGASGSVSRAGLVAAAGTSSAGSGRSWVRMQPAELATTQSAASHRRRATQARDRQQAGARRQHPGISGSHPPSAGHDARHATWRAPPDRFADGAWRTGCETFTGVMLPLEPDRHTSRGITARTVLFRPRRHRLSSNRPRIWPTRNMRSSPYFMRAFCRFDAVAGCGNLTKISCCVSGHRRI